MCFSSNFRYSFPSLVKPVVVHSERREDSSYSNSTQMNSPGLRIGPCTAGVEGFLIEGAGEGVEVEDECAFRF